MERKASRGQLLALGGILVQSVPADLAADVAQRWIGDPESLRAALRDVLARPDLISWGSLYAACKQQVVPPGSFNEKNFPLEAARLDDNDWKIRELQFPLPTTGDQILGVLETEGYRKLDGMKRAMKFIAENPQLQLHHPVVVTAYWSNPQDNQLYVPVFDNIDGKRVVRLRVFTRSFRPGCGWLVLERISR